MKSKLNAVLGLLILSFLLSYCSESGSKAKAKPYFDVEDFFNNEIFLLRQDSSFYVKSLNADGKTDDVKSKYPDWKKEFQLFYEADINKEAYLGRMKADILRNTMDSSGQSFAVVYTPLDKSLTVKTLKITFGRHHEVKDFYAHLESSSFLDAIVSDLHYVPGKNFEISTKEHTMLIGDSYYTVKGNIYRQDEYFQ